MADFRTHVTTSSVLGVGYAMAGLVGMSVPWETAVVAGGLCGVAGMLPDIDSETGVPARELSALAASVVPMLLVDRFQSLGLRYDMMVLVTGAMYAVIRFLGPEVVGRMSVHRGMFHSIPAALIFTGIAFLICGCNDLTLRYYKAGAVLAGVLSHLMLDELYSIEWRGGRWNVKRSFGTAFKLWGSSGWGNFSTYAKLGILGVMIAGEPSVMQRIAATNPKLASRIGEINDLGNRMTQQLRNDAGHAIGQLPGVAQSSTSSSSPVPNTNDRPNYDAPGGFRPNSAAGIWRDNSPQAAVPSGRQRLTAWFETAGKYWGGREPQ